MLRVWILLGILFFLVVHWNLAGLSKRAQQLLTRIILGGATVLGLLLLVRAGMPWLAAAGGVVAATFRWFGPLLLRLLPFLLPLLGRRSPPNDGEREQPQSRPPSSRPPSSRPPSQMSRAEALEVLGLADGATDDEVRAAYSDLIKKVHPDRGGTAYLAARVNLARDLLLSKHK